MTEDMARAALPWFGRYSDDESVPTEDLQQFIGTAAEFGHKVVSLQVRDGRIYAGCAWCLEGMQWDTIDTSCRR
jgi:hypothetical protein